MKIVDRKTFLAMPAGTLFSKYEPCVFGALEIKGDTLENCGDFGVQQIADAIECYDSGDFGLKCTMMENGISVGLDLDCQGRDGLFDENQLFAVWEPKDVEALIERLSDALCTATSLPRKPDLT